MPNLANESNKITLLLNCTGLCSDFSKHVINLFKLSADPQDGLQININGFFWMVPSGFQTLYVYNMMNNQNKKLNPNIFANLQWKRMDFSYSE